VIRDWSTPVNASRRGPRLTLTRKLGPKHPPQSSITESLEREARRIAQTLHDEAGQMLASVHMKLDELAHSLPESYNTPIEEIKCMLSHVEDELRRLSHELRPSILDDLGLMPALEFLAKGVAERSGVVVTLEGAIQGRLPGRVEVAVYRVVQEALTNVGKHARATRVRIRLWRRVQIHCSIRDDGVGADIAEVLKRRSACSLGWIGMRERIEALGGKLVISSAPGQGMEVRVTIPLPPQGDDVNQGGVSAVGDDLKLAGEISSCAAGLIARTDKLAAYLHNGIM